MSDFRLKCTKFDFGWGSAPDPARGAYSAPPDPLAGFKGPTSKGRVKGGEGRGKGKEEGGRREGRERDGREEKGGREGKEGKGKGAYRHFFFPTSSPASIYNIQNIQLPNCSIICKDNNKNAQK